MPDPQPPTPAAELEQTLHSELPITQDLGLRVRQDESDRVTLSAPLDLNHNHAGSAFAGSVNALATLAGWSWVWLLLRRHGIRATVVIQDSSITYSRPITSDFHAACVTPPEASTHRLLAMLDRSSRGRIRLEVTVSDEAGTAVRFVGRYVAMVGQAVG